MLVCLVLCVHLSTTVAKPIAATGYKTVRDDCSQSPCKNGATCVTVEKRYECHCLPGFIGRNCSQSEPLILARSSSILGIGSDAGHVLLIAVGSMVAISILLLIFFYICCYCCEKHMARIEPIVPTALKQMSHSNTFNKWCKPMESENPQDIEPLMKNKQNRYDAVDDKQQDPSIEIQADTKPLIDNKQDAVKEGE